MHHSFQLIFFLLCVNSLFLHALIGSHLFLVMLSVLTHSLKVSQLLTLLLWWRRAASQLSQLTLNTPRSNTTGRFLKHHRCGSFPSRMNGQREEPLSPNSQQTLSVQGKSSYSCTRVVLTVEWHNNYRLKLWLNSHLSQWVEEIKMTANNNISKLPKTNCEFLEVVNYHPFLTVCHNW